MYVGIFTPTYKTDDCYIHNSKWLNFKIQNVGFLSDNNEGVDPI